MSSDVQQNHKYRQRQCALANNTPNVIFYVFIKDIPLNNGPVYSHMYNPKSEKVGTVWKTQIKKEVVISKFTLTCISLQTIWTQNILCFVWSTSCHL